MTQLPRDIVAHRAFAWTPSMKKSLRVVVAKSRGTQPGIVTPPYVICDDGVPCGPAAKARGSCSTIVHALPAALITLDATMG
jgi:hypothetical protein